MKNINLLFVLMLLVFAAGCKKDDDPAKNEKDVPKLKTYTGHGTKFTYTYDSEGRLATESWADFTLEYAYFQDSIKVQIYTPTLGNYYIYKLNSDGLATSSYRVNGNVLAEQHEYTYDANGYMTSDGWNDFTWNNGNMVFSTDLGTSLTYTDITSTVGNYNKGLYFLGKSSKNVEKTMSNTYGEAHTYTYTKDDSERIISQSSDVDGTVAAYTYY